MAKTPKGFNSRRLGLSYSARQTDVSPSVETENLPLSQHMYNVAYMARMLSCDFGLKQPQKLLVIELACHFRLHEVNPIAFSEAHQETLRDTHTQAQINQFVRDAIAGVMDHDPELRDILFDYHANPLDRVEFGIVWYADKVQEVLFLLGQLFRGNRFVLAHLVDELDKLDARLEKLKQVFPNSDWGSLYAYVCAEVEEKLRAIHLDTLQESTTRLNEFLAKARREGVLTSPAPLSPEGDKDDSPEGDDGA